MTWHANGERGLLVAADYKVTEITKTSTPPGSGVLGPATMVHFETIPEGVVGSVIIPDSMLTADEARDRIAQQVATIKAILTL